MTASVARGPVVPWRLVLGLAVLAIGMVFLADGAGLLNADSALAAWPLAVIVLGVIVILQPDTANHAVGAVLLLAGVWLLLDNLGVWSYPFWRTWPYLLILVGGWMIFRVRRMRQREAAARLEGSASGGDYVAGFAFLDHVHRDATAGHLRHGEVSAVLGSCRLDLGGATGDPAHQTVVDAFALFGTIQVQVPAGWNVDARVLPLLGRVESPAPAAAGPTVVIQGSVIGGRVSVAVARAG
jgi:hypothetical protein